MNVLCNSLLLAIIKARTYSIIIIEQQHAPSKRALEQSGSSTPSLKRARQETSTPIRRLLQQPEIQNSPSVSVSF